MYPFKKFIRSNEGFTLIELLVVLGALSVLGIFALPRFLEIIQKTEKVIAIDAILKIKSECENNHSLGGDLIFTPASHKTIIPLRAINIAVPIKCKVLLTSIKYYI